jgi:TIR domain
MANEDPAGPLSVSDGPSFWAFISYSHRDEKAAARLHRDLETYRIPRALVGKPNGDRVIPRRLFPVFRDRDELASSPDLTDQIKGALKRSGSLVVICSPHAAQSRYVDEEIRLYRSFGHSDRILSIIVAGEPSGSSEHGSSDQECFPSALGSPVVGVDGVSRTGTTPIAADLRRGKDKPRDALLKIVAGVLGIRFDELRQRDQQRRNANRIKLGVLFVSSVLILVASFLVLSDADVMLPGSEGVRTWLDSRQLTVYRPVATRSEASAAAAKGRQQLILSIVRLQLADGLFSWRIKKTGEGDTWTSAQALAALVSAPELRREDWHQLMAAFDQLFSAHVERDGIGVSGWRFEQGRPPPGVISLWMVSALARALQRRDLFGDDDRATLVRYYRIAVEAAERLHPTANGGWNMYANQDAKGDHSAYSTVLALQALLDVQAAGLPWNSSASSPSRLISGAAAWLISNFESERPNPGWAAFPARVLESERDVLDGMTLQIYSTLLRAEAQAGVILPTNLVRSMTRHLIASGKREPEYRKDETDFPILVFGRYEKEGVQFTWYPWAIQASLLWLERAGHREALPAELQAVRRTVGRIVARPDGRFLTHVLGEERKTYEASEFLFCLSAVH